jgi:glycosyltransferase involved in cell wall biosynthesis
MTIRCQVCKERKPLNVLFIASKRNVGLSIYFAKLATALKRAGNNIILISASIQEEPNLFKKIENTKIKHYKLDGLDHIEIKTLTRKAQKLGKIIDQENIDMVHVNGIRHLLYAFLASRLFARKKNTKIVVTIHSILHGTPYMEVALLIESALINFCANMALPVCKSTALKLKNHGTLSSRMTTVYNAVDLRSTRRPEKTACQDKFFFGALSPKPTITIGCCAELIPRKGHIYLIQAFFKILREYPDARLILTGSGTLENYLKKLCRELKIDNSVTFTGKINYENLRQLLEKIDIYAFPSLSELFPLAILEAMAAGKPIVATDVGGIHEAMEDGKNGILVPPKNPQRLAEAIIELIRNPEKAKRMGEENRKTAMERFSMEKIAAQITKCYELVTKST